MEGNSRVDPHLADCAKGRADSNAVSYEGRARQRNREDRSRNMCLIRKMQAAPVYKEGGTFRSRQSTIAL